MGDITVPADSGQGGREEAIKRLGLHESLGDSCGSTLVIRTYLGCCKFLIGHSIVAILNRQCFVKVLVQAFWNGD